MFCGWRLFDSYPVLEKLGSGTLTIDSLTQACSFNGQPIPSLSIARELAAWLKQDLADYSTSVNSIREAMLTVDLQFGTVPKAERRTRDAHFGPNGQHLVPPIFIACEISCRSRVATDEKVYESEYRDREEWPSGWPQK